MPAINKPQSSKKYLSVARGKLCEKVQEGTEGALKIEYDIKSGENKGTKGIKYEIQYPGWSGKIISMGAKQTSFGEVFNVVFEDAQISMSTEARYFQDFAKKIMGADLSKEIEIAPFDFQNKEGNRITGVQVTQDGEKMKNYYWDELEGKACHGMPVPDFNTKMANQRQWKQYFMVVTEFLISQLIEKSNSIEVADNWANQTSEKLGLKEELPTVQLEDEINVEDIPF